jgi:hypothetical protein
MFEFLFGKKNVEEPRVQSVNDVFEKLEKEYPESEISKERKAELKKLVSKFGYLPYSYQKALNEINENEILYILKFKWTKNKIFTDGKFNFDNENISALARNNQTNSSWIQHEGHDIKLINLAALGDGNKSQDTGKFMDWLRQLAILPTGNLNNDIYSTTIYLVPFHPRDFGCAYLPRSSEVSEKIFDKHIEDVTGMDAKAQVKMFITLSQLAGHPVIYDILPQTGRFSKAVLANPEIARWFDIDALQSTIKTQIDNIASKMQDKYDSDDIDVVKEICKKNNDAGELSEDYQKIYDEFEQDLEEIKIKLSNDMMTQSNQLKIQKRVKNVIADILGVKPNKKLEENEITKQIDIIAKLIKEGLWPAPGGAWCSAGVPVYDKMSDCGGYPTFKHYDYKGSDVTEFANLDCQTPFYFAFLETGEINTPIVEYFINYMKKLQKEYNFDGFRIDHIDHIVDRISENEKKPISYRAPRVVLKKLNNTMKKEIPYFATLAEYMLWDNFLKEYHQDMNFDLLWGNDIVSQNEKTPEKIDEDNKELANYNINFKDGEMLSILKTYNNQDGEFRCIDQYPGQLGKDGALFKWFKYKFLPGGKYAQRSMLYVDGDESYTQKGIESVIGDEISMTRGDDEDFYQKFNAIDKFVKNDNIISGGEAQVIDQDDDGFAVWMISKEPLKQSYLVIANSQYPTEKHNKTDDNGEKYAVIINGKGIKDKEFKLPGDYAIKGEYKFIDGELKFEKSEENLTELHFETLKPSEFKIFLLERA